MYVVLCDTVSVCIAAGDATTGTGTGTGTGVVMIFSLIVREAVSYRGLFTAGWFGVREKHCSRLKIYECFRASEQAELRLDICI